MCPLPLLVAFMEKSFVYKYKNPLIIKTVYCFFFHVFIGDFCLYLETCTLIKSGLHLKKEMFVVCVFWLVYISEHCLFIFVLRSWYFYPCVHRAFLCERVVHKHVSSIIFIFVHFWFCVGKCVDACKCYFILSRGLSFLFLSRHVITWFLYRCNFISVRLTFACFALAYLVCEHVYIFLSNPHIDVNLIRRISCKWVCII